VVTPGVGLALRIAAVLTAAGACLLAAVNPTRPDEGIEARGQRVFQRCYSCHTVGPNDTAQLQGPSLYGIVGRRAAAIAGFEYSDAMKAKGAAGLIWTADALDRFIADPDAFVPGTPMVILPPLRDDQERAYLIAYLSGRR
jgi:cytochrome c2